MLRITFGKNFKLLKEKKNLWKEKKKRIDTIDQLNKLRTIY